MTAANRSSSTPKLQAQPLYARVQQALVDRLIAGNWRPGTMLPSEFAIAEELGVSQGTVRKALDEMTALGLLVRKQGRGTFVAEAEDTSILFRFYRLTRDDASTALAAPAASFPDSTYLSQVCGTATSKEQEVLGLNASDKVWRFERVRSDHVEPILWESLVLPVSRFPSIDETTQLPNNVYQFYGNEHGIIVARVEEKLRAVIAPPNIVSALGLESGAPMLEIDRRAIALDGQIVEWRTSLCRSDTIHYRNELK